MASVDSYGSPQNPQLLTTPQPQLPLPSDRVRSIMETDSPLMRQAATQGKQYAQRRGLLNSSLAAEASQHSLLAHALPIAQADTSAALQGRSLNITQQQTDDTRSRGLLDHALNRDRLTSDDAYRNRQMELTDRINTQRLNLDRERFESDAVYREQQLAQERQLRQEQLALDRELGTRRLDIDASVAGRGAQQSAWNTYAAMWSALLNNPNIDATTRSQYMLFLRNFLGEMNAGIEDMQDTPLVPPPLPEQQAPTSDWRALFGG